MTNSIVEAAQKIEVQTLAESKQTSRIDAANCFADMCFLDSAELALVGGGGAHGGNTL